MRGRTIWAVATVLLALSACGKKQGSTSDEAAAPAGEPSPETSVAENTATTTETTDAGTLTLVPQAGMTLKARHAFDLKLKELHFAPDPSGYKLTVTNLAVVADKGTELKTGKTSSGFNFAFEKTLPFPFAFANQSWTKVFVNSKGNLSFGDPEYTLWTNRNPWSDAGLRSVAAAINLLALDGKDKLIAGLWDNYKDARIFVKESATEILFTWIAQKNGWYKAKSSQGYADDSVANTFQIRLHADGRIDLLYPDVKTDVGIVGLFDGQDAGTSTLIDETTDGIVNGADPKVRIKALRVFDEDTTLRFQYEMEQAVAATEATGSRSYRIFLDGGSVHCREFGVTVSTAAVGSACGAAPRVVRQNIAGKFVDVWVSKERLGDQPTYAYSGDVVWWGGPAGAFSQVHFDAPKPIAATELAPLTHSLAASDGQVFSSNIYEVFHETEVSRDGFDMLIPRAKDHAMDEDMALSFTDFAIDDLYGVTPSTGAINVAIKGIGSRQASPQDAAALGMPKLQVTTDVTYLGDALNLPEGIDIYNYAWKNHGPTLRLFQHELMHRWGMHLSFVHPKTKQKVPLNDGDGHWLDGLDTTSFVSVSSNYSDTAYTETSPMGGAIWKQNDDGTFTPSYRPPNAPTGLSALDLYVLGLLPAKDVPDLTLIENLHALGDGKFSGTKLTIKIADIVAAEGEREPSAVDSQKSFKLSAYLIHAGAEPVPALKDRAEDELKLLKQLFDLSTGGRMQVR